MIKLCVKCGSMGMLNRRFVCVRKKEKRREMRNSCQINGEGGMRDGVIFLSGVGKSLKIKNHALFQTPSNVFP